MTIYKFYCRIKHPIIVLCAFRAFLTPQKHAMRHDAVDQSSSGSDCFLLNMLTLFCIAYIAKPTSASTRKRMMMIMAITMFRFMVGEGKWRKEDTAER